MSQERLGCLILSQFCLYSSSIHFITRYATFTAKIPSENVFPRFVMLTTAGLAVTRTLYNSNLPLIRSNFHFPSDRFLHFLPSITRTPDNSNFFLFPLKVGIIESRLYIYRGVRSRTLTLHEWGQKNNEFPSLNNVEIIRTEEQKWQCRSQQ